MRKLSMKNPGTPAIEEDSESGSGGVSAEGFGARLPRLGLACAPPVEPASRLFASLGCEAVPGCGPRAPVPDGVLPCALWPLTWGAAVVGALGVEGVEVAGASVVVLGVLVLGAGSGAGAGAVSVEAAFSGVVVGVEGLQGSSAASELAGAAAMSRASEASRSFADLPIAQFPSR